MTTEPGSGGTNAEGSEEPNPESSGRLRTVIAYAIIGIVLAVLLVAGSIAVPPALPDTLLGWLVLIFGTLLLLITTVIGAYIRPLSARVVRLLARLPDRLRQRSGPKRTVRLVTSAVVLVPVVAAAAFLGPPLVAPPPKPPEPLLEPGELVLLSGTDVSANDPRQILLDQWNAANPENRARFETASGPHDDQHTRMTADAAPEGEHKADIYVLDLVWMAEFIHKGYIRTLDDGLRAPETDGDFLPNVLATNTDLHGGRQGLWGLPLNTDAGLLFHRTDLADVPVPTTWDDYLGESAAQALESVRDNPANAVAAGQLQTATAVPIAAPRTTEDTAEEILTVNALEAIWAAGSELVDEAGQLVRKPDGTVDVDARARQALVDLARAYNDPRITLPGLGDDALEPQQESDLTAALACTQPPS